MDMNIFKKLTHDDELERCDAIEYLALFLDNDEIANNIINAFNDCNYLVRCEAYEAFYGYNKKNINDVLIKRLKAERSKYARMYICSTLSNVIRFFPLNEDQIKIILYHCKKEKELNVLIGYWSILYQITAKSDYIIRILNCLNDQDYHIRCNVINFLADIIDDDNRELILYRLKKQLQTEETNAVKSSIKVFLENKKYDNRSKY